MQAKPIVLYAGPQSLYAGRARSYLIKSGRPYRERTIGTPHFLDEIVPLAGGRRSMPTIELPDGAVIRDGVAIVDHFEHLAGHPFSPVTPRQRVVSRLLDVIGAEGMLRPAMHYRWNFDDQQLTFLRYHFRTLAPGRDAGLADRDMRYIRREVNPGWGLVAETEPLIEALYEELLSQLDAHFVDYPYFLGGRPSIGDFGMIAPLYGHLGRDPVPAALMQNTAPAAWRWVERMNRSEPDIGEFANPSEDYLPDDEIPETLIAVLKHLAIDFVPETRAACQAINAWLDANPDLEEGKTCRRFVGENASFEVRGVPITAWAQPFRFYLLQRVQDEVAALDAGAREGVLALLDAIDMKEILDCKLSRAIGRRDNLEVWLA